MSSFIYAFYSPLTPPQLSQLCLRPYTAAAAENVAAEKLITSQTLLTLKFMALTVMRASVLPAN